MERLDEFNSISCWNENFSFQTIQIWVIWLFLSSTSFKFYLCAGEYEGFIQKSVQYSRDFYSDVGKNSAKDTDSDIYTLYHNDRKMGRQHGNVGGSAGTDHELTGESRKMEEARRNPK